MGVAGDYNYQLKRFVTEHRFQIIFQEVLQLDKPHIPGLNRLFR